MNAGDKFKIKMMYQQYTQPGDIFTNANLALLDTITVAAGSALNGATVPGAAFLGINKGESTTDTVVFEYLKECDTTEFKLELKGYNTPIAEYNSLIMIFLYDGAGITL